MRVQNDTIYLGDNGRACCGEHLGMTAKMTGRDLSGQPIMAVTPEMVTEAASDGWEVCCEQCGKAASRILIAR